MWPILPSLVALIVIVIFVIYWATPENLASQKPVSSLDYWLHRYQTLAAGALAFLAGLLAYLAVKGQIAFDIEIEDARDVERKKGIAIATASTITAVIRDMNLLAEILGELPAEDPLDANQAACVRDLGLSLTVFEANVDRASIGELGYPVGYSLGLLFGEVSLVVISWKLENFFDKTTAGKLTRLLNSLLFRLTVARNVLRIIGTATHRFNMSDLAQFKIGWSLILQEAERYGRSQNDLNYMEILVDPDN